MEELGIDISGHRSKHVDEFASRQFGTTITVCDNARNAARSFSARPSGCITVSPPPSITKYSEERLPHISKARADKGQPGSSTTQRARYHSQALSEEIGRQLG